MVLVIVGGGIVVEGGGVRAGQFQAAYCSFDSSLEPIHCAQKTDSVYPGR